eukprot:TRINITY_DN15689_c0_g1_i1.p1 TRINITY_DN15689_c0_g1~~TRINITY_DN15689_c0_g1_i1.p1  ORF type:complete len:495 (-),score=103.18 TRINITY_DN15689_c0_g1_i1:857-2341(-)
MSDIESDSSGDLEASWSMELEAHTRCESSAEPAVEVLDEADVVEELRQQAQDAAALLNLTTSAACKVMRQYGWNYDRLQDAYFNDQEATLLKLGLSIGAKGFELADKSVGRTCPLCFDECGPGEGDFWALLPCHHALCSDCWRQTVTMAVRQGRACASLDCPVGVSTGRLGIKACRTIVDDGIFRKFLPPELMARYDYFVVRFFVDTNPCIRWCQGRNCTRALRCRDPSLSVVGCSCGFKLCFKCNNEAHAPATCEQMTEWRAREAGEGDNLAYITANTKPCPTCKTPIEKNEGCNHMTCARCKAEGRPPDWCWVCAQVWDFQGKHGSSWYSCPFQSDEAVTKRQFQAAAAASELYKYVKYYEGYANHKRTAELQASKDMEKAQKFRDHILEATGVTADYVTDAVKSILEARKYLQYTYIYSFGLPVDRQTFFDWKVKSTEEAVITLSNMMEDIYRFGVSLQSDPPHSREAIIDKAGALRHKLKDLMEGLDNDV